MKAKFYYKREDALKAAETLAKELDTFVDKKLTPMDDRCDFEPMDDDAARLQWSGIVAAYGVWLGGNDYAYFAYWDA